VREAVVLAREDPFGGKQLVAYLVPSDGQAPPWEELRQFMQQKLPDYMLPAAFVSLDAFPLTPNGKVDRRALPAPERSRFEGEILVAPRTPTEEMLAGIWSQVLRLGQVSVYDNFFALGGHSLLATQVVSRLRQLFQVEVSLLTFFEAPTVASLAEHLEAAQRIEIPPIVPVPHAGDLPLSFAQQRLWFVDQLEPGNPFYNIPFVLHLVGPLDVAALAHSLNEIVRRHQALRTTFVVVNGQPTQVIASTLSVSLPLVDVWDLPKARQEAQVERLIVEEARRPFCLAQGPLLRAAVLRLDRACPVQPTDALECCAQQGRRDEHILLVTMHHVISDGWSLGVFTHEIAALYPAFVAGEPSWRAGDKQSLLPELPIQYADFTLWQRAWLRGEVLEAQLSYWRRQLAAAPITLELPTDRPRPALQTFRGRTQALLLPEALSGALKALSQQEGVTLFMTLLAAFKVLLFRYTGQDDIVVGTPIANRNRGEIEGLIGFFVNTLVLRTDLRGNPSFRELLHRVRKVTLGAYAHQDLPFEVLVEKLQPERDLSRNPLFQIMFVLQNAPAESGFVGECGRPRRSDHCRATSFHKSRKSPVVGRMERHRGRLFAGRMSARTV
jgi:acyl carrier protein